MAKQQEKTERNLIMTQLRVNNHIKRAIGEALNIKPNLVQIGHNYKLNKLEISIPNTKLSEEQEKVLVIAADFLQNSYVVL